MNYEKHKKFFTVFAYAVIFGALAYFILFRYFSVIAPFVFAILFAMIINPLVDLFHQRLRINRKFAGILVILLVFGVLGTFLTACISEIYSLCKGFLTEFLNNPNSFDATAQGLNVISERISRLLHTDFDLVESVKNIIMPAAQWAVSAAGNIAKSVPQIFVAVIVFILASFFFVSDRKLITDFCLKYLKPKHLRSIERLKKIARDSILGYVKAQLVLMSITFVELLIGFSIMNLMKIADLNYIFLIALGTAVLDALPVFGTGTVLIPWTVIKVVAGDFNMAIALLIQYVVCICVRQFMEPKIVGESLGLHPLVTLFSMYIGLNVVGVAGMILFPIIALFLVRLYQTGAFDHILKREKNSKI
ncbi:sporulation integral membrane protein YtvI [Acetivibrio sp. MSJd-27]|jgi:sporulation integral membrane protein ytvI|uniref:sporulation integral membrane protein YtvI n=1 Tax=Acetivibrio sp. MSJd-27 TaxID=2841523 RepID=UPI0015AF55A8|nr:sporulation integral membrane protein YtvI [Acetivibrio sp. MSJd-27]MBU5450614.1 sporulation integral membrane protein YtvI [Acetivibrio sp. MSJd-27]